MVFAVIKAAGATAVPSDPFYGYPPWLVVLVGAVLAAIALWVFGKLLKWAIWVLIILVLVGGAITAAKMLLGA